MSSKRELIVQNIMETLRDQTVVQLNHITRDPGFSLPDLANTAFPAVLVQSGNESRNSITQGGSSATRECVMEVVITVWTNSLVSVDTLHNQLLDSIETVLEVSATRGGNALDTELVSTITGTGDTAPYQSFTMVFEIPYLYTKGNP